MHEQDLRMDRFQTRSLPPRAEPPAGRVGQPPTRVNVTVQRIVLVEVPPASLT